MGGGSSSPKVKYFDISNREINCASNSFHSKPLKGFRIHNILCLSPNQELNSSQVFQSKFHSKLDNQLSNKSLLIQLKTSKNFHNLDQKGCSVLNARFKERVLNLFNLKLPLEHIILISITIRMLIAKFLFTYVQSKFQMQMEFLFTL